MHGQRDTSKLNRVNNCYNSGNTIKCTVLQFMYSLCHFIQTYGIMSCWCGRRQWNSHIHTVHVVPSNTLGNPAYHTNRTLCHMLYKKISVLPSWRWALVCPKHVELILEIIKTVIAASSWFSIFYFTYKDVRIRVYFSNPEGVRE
jgi:hypothetical protein